MKVFLAFNWGRLNTANIQKRLAYLELSRTVQINFRKRPPS